jgi:hypothetical protein
MKKTKIKTAWRVRLSAPARQAFIERRRALRMPAVPDDDISPTPKQRDYV